MQKKKLSGRAVFQISSKNLFANKTRTCITVLVRSMGIMGMAMILALFQGVQDYIREYGQEIDPSYRITIEDHSSETLEMLCMISCALIVFIVVSFFLSSLTTGLVTYISVVERTEEVGILRSIGASKRDVARVFHAEILMQEIFSGSSGILGSVVLRIPINLMVKKLTGIEGLVKLPLQSWFVLLVISIALTVTTGMLAAMIAARKDPVRALRNER